jgi:hypothetical protein
MLTIRYSAHSFQEEFRRFAAFVEVQPEQEGRMFDSFLSGFVRTREYYKSDLHREGLRRLNVASWKDRDVGTGCILGKVVDAIEIPAGPSQARNNLVEWEGGRYKPNHLPLIEARDGGPNRMALESALFDFFTGDLEPEEAMDELVRYLGRKYDVLAYLFFLRDWERFMPIAPTYFEDAFARLQMTAKGEPIRLVGKASWENYAVYNAALKLMQDALHGRGIEQVRLIDAHSFVWMLARGVPVEGPLRTITPTEAEEPVPPTRNAPLIDWEQWAAACRLNGKLAEELVEKRELERLESAGRPDLAAKVRIVSEDHRLGYDVWSVELTGEPRHLEVKSARREDGCAIFYVTENEWQRSRELPNYWFCLVFGIRSELPEVEYLSAAEFAQEWLTPMAHSARVPARIGA